MTVQTASSRIYDAGYAVCAYDIITQMLNIRFRSEVFKIPSEMVKTVWAQDANIPDYLKRHKYLSLVPISQVRAAQGKVS